MFGDKLSEMDATITMVQSRWDNFDRSLPDPLAATLLPPSSETQEERELRIRAETEAKRVSDKIDEMIRQEKLAKKKVQAEVNVLLLGQSESGKSTTLKQFQLLHSPSSFHMERIAWRVVIYLNLVRSIQRILDALSPEVAVEEHDDKNDSIIISSDVLPQPNARVIDYDLYRQRLAPLVKLEEKLTRLLTAPDQDGPTHNPHPHQSSNFLNGLSSTASGRLSPTMKIPRNDIPPLLFDLYSSPARVKDSSKNKEIFIRTSVNWKKAFQLGSISKSPKSAHSGEIEGWWEDPKDPVHALYAFAPAMQELWKDPNVQNQLEEKRLRLEESAGFYLNDIPRITAKKYIPTNDDILKARLKTMGVVEHSFLVPSNVGKGTRWKIYDVGGAQNQRHTWAPYFQDVNAIIFLAPISAFDQVLAEDPRVNRLEDSLLLWKGVCANKLLSNVNMILFLNKCDLLQAKLEAGVHLNEYMLSYGDRPNDYNSVSKYFRHKFGTTHYSVTSNKDREPYIHFTTVIDIRRTGDIIADGTFHSAHTAHLKTHLP
ncbi:hypothetical protein GYMLUDRAFT_211852 [Collybiopsis luxurians FD-317 M1]|nr:hypothetical protein GYMLUDRAFT_211852 [Collybiopsis luxurians FD-317 M1]